MLQNLNHKEPRLTKLPELKRNGVLKPSNGQLKFPKHDTSPTFATPSKLDRFIDKSVDGLSTPKAIFIQTGVTAAYIVANVVTYGAFKFDPYPFLFLNFIYSLASGYATVFVLNSNRRQDAAAKERMRDAHALNEVILDRLCRIEKHLHLSSLDTPDIVRRIRAIDSAELVRAFKENGNGK